MHHRCLTPVVHFVYSLKPIVSLPPVVLPLKLKYIGRSTTMGWLEVIFTETSSPSGTMSLTNTVALLCAPTVSGWSFVVPSENMNVMATLASVSPGFIMQSHSSKPGLVVRSANRNSVPGSVVAITLWPPMMTPWYTKYIGLSLIHIYEPPRLGMI